ncbi:MAG: hypothetical protein JST22_21635 [Bacteroidetes bacterium]|nr:hypothetical protein [Bacteroidota bacterium]
MNKISGFSHLERLAAASTEMLPCFFASRFVKVHHDREAVEDRIGIRQAA